MSYMVKINKKPAKVNKTLMFQGFYPHNQLMTLGAGQYGRSH